MLPFASLCLPDNIIPIPEAGIKNLQFFYISTLCASLLISLPQSTCLIKFSPEFRVAFIRGVTCWLKKFKIQKKKNNYNNNNNNAKIQTVLYCGKKRGKLLTPSYSRSPEKWTIKKERWSSFWVCLKVLHWNVKVDASKSHNRCREMAALAAVLDKRWVA